MQRARLLARSWRAGFAILLAVALGAGAVPPAHGAAPAEQASPGLGGTSWQVQAFNNGQAGVTAVLPGSSLSLTFGADGSVSGNSGCNNFSGSYAVSGSSLMLSGLISTLQACLAADVSAQEQAFLNALNASTMYAVNGNQLALSDSNGTVQVMSTQAPISLSGTSWLVRSYNNGLGGVATVPAGIQVTVVFGDDGVVSGSTGCNNYTGFYTEDGSSVSVSTLASTLRACLSSDAASVEQAFLAALPASSDYEVAGIQLTIRDADGNTLLVLTQQQPDTLSGTAWRVVAVNNGREAVVSLVPGSQLTLVLGADGAAIGTTGCNNFSGLYASDASSLSFGPLIVTRRACRSDAFAGQEQAFLAALAASSTYELTGDQLTVRDANGATQFQAVRPSVQPVPGSAVP